MVAMPEGGISVASHSRLLIPSYQSLVTRLPKSKPARLSPSGLLRSVMYKRLLLREPCDRLDQKSGIERFG